MSETPLDRILKRLIRDEGPIDVARWMALCLGHPRHGYYMARDPFGAGGDFVTAPEISQMFGELLGLWTAQAWLDLGAPAAFDWVELGPGRGTLMKDARRAASRVPGFIEAARIVLVETSPRLRAVPEATLRAAPAETSAAPSRRAPFRSASWRSPSWEARFDEASQRPVILVANELFDALPVRRFVRDRGAWRESLIGLEGEALAFGLSAEPSDPPGAPVSADRGAVEGAVWEWSPEREALAAAIGARIARAGGAALVVDYGHAESGVGDTLQAVRSHAFAPLLERAGEVDLTSHVDFARLARAAKAAGARAHGPVEQGTLLKGLGIGARAQALALANPDRAEAFEVDRARLVEGGASMGRLFKALALSAPGAPIPPAFSPPVFPNEPS